MIEVAGSGWVYGAMGAYLAVMVGLGIYGALGSQTLSDYFVGGRGMNRWVVALSAVASGRSSWLLLGFVGMAWKMGLAAIWAAVGYIAVEFALFWFYAPRLRRFAGAYDCITVPDFFAERLRDPGPLRVLLVAVMTLFLTGYVAAQFVAGGKAIEAGFQVDPTWGVIATAAVVLVYTLLGGFVAVSLTDVVQAVFMLGALVLVPLMALFAMGPMEVWTALGADASLDPFALALGVGVGLVGIGLGSPGSPHILARYLSIDDPEQLRVAAVVGTAWNVALAGGALALGLIGRVAYPTTQQLVNGDKELVFPMLAADVLHPALFGLVIASVFAAIMSTSDSQLLVAASAIARDLLQKVVLAGSDMSDGALVWVSRGVVVVLVVAATGFAFVAEDVVFWLALFAWAGLGAALGPTSILALYWRRTTWPGVAAGVVLGAVTAIVWYYTLKPWLYELIPAFAVGALATVVVSLVTRPPEDVDAMFDVMSGR